MIWDIAWILFVLEKVSLSEKKKFDIINPWIAQPNLNPGLGVLVCRTLIQNTTTTTHKAQKGSLRPCKLKYVITNTTATL